MWVLNVILPQIVQVLSELLNESLCKQKGDNTHSASSQRSILFVN